MGWLDLMLLRYANEVNGFSELFLTKLDVLSGLPEIMVCTDYMRGGKKINTLDFSGDARNLARCAPVYDTLHGWQEDVRGCRSFQSLPSAAQAYVEYIEQQTGLTVRYISVGPERSALIARD